MKTVLIIEDEEAAYQRLKKMIAETLPEANILSPVVSIRSAVEWFSVNALPDLIFLDVHLADGHSFEIFKKVKVTSPVIFTTAYDQYALEAFKVNSIDYLLKPIKKDDLKRAVDKFLHFNVPSNTDIDLNKLLSTLQLHPSNYKQRFVVKYGEHIKTIEIADSAYFYTENKANFLITKENKRFAIDYNLDQLELLLDPKKFFRINRQFIIGFHAITDMFSYSKSRVLIKLNPPSKLETIVSSERSASFKSWLDG
ncbi:MAG TPA: LytTR family DNA-binding domain-containing protein [Segetibacter sp.]|nr:LytTR family DNA-binding domain-containing protein [Segetibacter sp.]